MEVGARVRFARPDRRMGKLYRRAGTTGTVASEPRWDGKILVEFDPPDIGDMDFYVGRRWWIRPDRLDLLPEGL